jgi:GNAT superfamily N-acetyltransferase
VSRASCFLGRYARGVSEVVIREAERSDSEAIAAVHVRAWATAYSGLMPEEVLAAMTLERREATWRERLAEPSAGPTIVAADGDGTIIGFCALATPTRDEGEAADTAEVTALYVDPASWRGGVGSRLLATALERLRAEAFATVILWVLVGNLPARTFYERHGFAADGAVFDHDPPGTRRPSGLRAERMRLTPG